MPIDLDKFSNKPFNDIIHFYRRLREHEDEVKNHRMNWLWAMQGLLFTAEATAWGGEDFIKLIISVVGLFSCISIGYGITCSHSMLKKMDNNFCHIIQNALLKDYQELDKEHGEFLTIILGRLEREDLCFPRLLPWKYLQYLIAVIWLFVIIHVLFVSKYLYCIWQFIGKLFN